MSAQRLDEHKIIWEQKPALRAIYHDYYERIKGFTQPGLTLEIGGGTGNLKHYLPNVITSDILPMPWLDAVCDAQALPFKDQSFDNMVAVDVLHHIQRPVRFLKEVQRLLRKGGRLVLLEPAITKLSWFFYHFLHPEPVLLKADPLLEGPLDPAREAFDANQAIPELLFGSFYQAFQRQFPDLALIQKDYLSFFAYPLSGGFRPWSLVSPAMVDFLLKLERQLEKPWGKHLGFRLLLVLERS